MKSKTGYLCVSENPEFDAFLIVLTYSRWELSHGQVGAAGQAASSSDTLGGAGGNGLANPIVGSTTGQLDNGTYYLAGGGGGASFCGSAGSKTGASGGLGGGGAGGTTPGNYGNGTAGAAGTTNPGGGGGGSVYDNTGGAGGSGVVILSIPTASYSGQVVGSPTVTTSGSNTIMTFASSGSYTA